VTEEVWDEKLAQLIDAHVSGKPLSHNDLDEALPIEYVELLDLADLLWEAGHGAPPLEQDPVAAMLGLVPDSARSLDGGALKRALATAGLSVSSLAQKLSDRGWDVASRDVFNWQTRDSARVPPALIQAIAEVTGTAAEKLVVDCGRSPAHLALKSMIASAKFREPAERWARLRRTTVDLGASALESRLAASVFRGAQPKEAEMLASLEALVSALETGRSSDGGD
jgi:hypothetical protein